MVGSDHTHTHRTHSNWPSHRNGTLCTHFCCLALPHQLFIYYRRNDYRMRAVATLAVAAADAAATAATLLLAVSESCHIKIHSKLFSVEICLSDEFDSIRCGCGKWWINTKPVTTVHVHVSKVIHCTEHTLTLTHEDDDGKFTQYQVHEQRIVARAHHSRRDFSMIVWKYSRFFFIVVVVLVFVFVFAFVVSVAVAVAVVPIDWVGAVRVRTIYFQSNFCLIAHS